MPVLVADGDVSGEEASMDMKGSLDSTLGDVCGDDGLWVLIWLRRFDTEVCRDALEEVGDARRESVLRNVDRRFGGGVEYICESRGSSGTLISGWRSFSFWSSSNSSFAVLVNVKL